jgi:peptidyl-prolyl cis-trans isomerase B (cyclophilin B)
VKRLPLLALVLALAACGGGGGSKTTTTAAGETTATHAAQPARASGCTKATEHLHANRQLPNQHLKLDPSKTWRLVFDTTCGTFIVTLNPKLAPNATGSLVSLTRRGFFADTFFHRIVPGFVIQGGDPTGTGTGGPGYETHDKVPASTAYDHGVMAMAKTSTEPAGTAGSQFFVMTATSALAPDYAVVGKITNGLGVVDRIGKLGDASERPTQPVVIRTVKVQTS